MVDDLKSHSFSTAEMVKTIKVPYSMINIHRDFSAYTPL